MTTTATKTIASRLSIESASLDPAALQTKFAELLGTKCESVQVVPLDSLVDALGNIQESDDGKKTLYYYMYHTGAYASFSDEVLNYKVKASMYPSSRNLQLALCVTVSW